VRYVSEDELQKLREKKLAELQQQQQQQQAMQASQASQANVQQAQFEAQKKALLLKLLSSEARSRLTNIKMARPEFGNSIEMQLIQVYQKGMLKGQTPLTDTQFKTILVQIQQQSTKRERKIKFR
jgi:programmed cell death protein 5